VREVVWFRRDLRLRDNPALAAALAAARSAGDRPTAIFIHDPEREAPWQPGGASRWYLHHSLQSLAADLAGLDIRLLLRRGDSVGILSELAAGGMRRLYRSRLHEPAQLQRDAEVDGQLGRLGVDLEYFDDGGFLPPERMGREDGSHYRVFTPFWRRLRTRLSDALAQAPLHEPAQPSPQPPEAPSGLAELQLLDRHPWHTKLATHWQPGEADALRRWRRFLRTGLSGYTEDRDRPDLTGTSELSPALHFGEISVWRLLQDLQPYLAGEAGPAVTRAAEKFLAEIGWREFARHVLWWAPQSSGRSLDSRFEDAAIWGGEADHLLRWQRGETGVPLIDAGMRQLWETGWMHNRVRMVTASFLTKNLGIHWIQGARWFWDTLVDADLASNSLGWQWVAGCGVDAAPYYRIFNPELQATRFDPEGSYRRRWGGGAATPIVDLKASREAALARYRALPARI